MLQVKRTNSADKDFIHLVSLLDSFLKIIDGEEHTFYGQHNKTDNIKHVLVGYFNNEPIACGAFKNFAPETVEIKRMFVVENQRGKRFAGIILSELETWAASLGIKKCVLETGKKQPEAIRLYEKSGYKRIPNYEPYVHIDNSVCMEKILSE